VAARRVFDVSAVLTIYSGFSHLHRINFILTVSSGYAACVHHYCFSDFGEIIVVFAAERAAFWITLCCRAW